MRSIPPPTVMNRLAFLPLLFPAYSFSASVIGIFVQLRFETLIFLWGKKFSAPRTIWFLLTLAFLPLLLVPFLLIDIADWLLYLPLFLTYLWIIFFLASKARRNFFLTKFFKISFLLNASYIAVQASLISFGFTEWTMFHSNHSSQSEYIIPFDSFLRFTGLWNENSPLVFYLIICFVYFRYLRCLLAWPALILILLSGSKFAYLFLLLYVFNFVRTEILISMLLLVLAYFFIHGDVLRSLENFIGVSPSVLRFEVLVNGVSSLQLLPAGFEERGWDVFSYHLRAYGVILGSLILLGHIIIIYRSVLSRDLSLVFFLSLLAHGSLAAIGHSLILLIAILTARSHRIRG